MNEVEFATRRVTNAVHTKGVLLQEEAEQLCSHLKPAEKRKVFTKLKERRYNTNEGLIRATSKSVSEEQIVDNEIFTHLVRPEYVHNSTEEIQVGTHHYKGIVAAGFPATVNENWLGKVTQDTSNIDFSIFIEPSSVRALEVYLSSELKKVENDLYKYQSKGMSNPSLESRKKELTEQLGKLIQGTYKLFNMSLYLAAKGTNQEKTQATAAKLVSSLHSQGIEPKYTSNYHEQLLKSVIPTGTNHLKGRKILVPGPAAAASFPFSSPFYEVDVDDGVLLGFNENGIPLAKSLWKLPKYVGVIIGASGSGKSYATKAFILNEQLANQTKVYILDPEDEYSEMCERIDHAEKISLSRTSKNIPNILSLMGGSLPEKLVALPKIMDVLLGGLSEDQKPVLEEAIIKTYAKKGITENNKSSWKRTPPKLSDLAATLKRMKTKAQEQLYSQLISRLSRYTTGVFKFMNQSGSGLDIQKDVVVFEFKSMPEEVRPVLMLTLLEFIKTRFQMDKQKKLLVMDEAWRVLKNKTEADYIEGFARTFRKANGALLLVTQSVAELQDSPEGRAYLANTAFQYILRTERIIANDTCKLFGLNKVEKDIVVNAKPGESVLVWGGKHHHVHVKVDPKTHDLITTNPNE